MAGSRGPPWPCSRSSAAGSGRRSRSPSSPTSTRAAPIGPRRSPGAPARAASPPPSWTRRSGATRAKRSTTRAGAGRCPDPMVTRRGAGEPHRRGRSGVALVARGGGLVRVGGLRGHVGRPRDRVGVGLATDVGLVTRVGALARAADHDLVGLDGHRHRSVAGPVLRVHGVVLHRGVEPEAVPLLTVIEGPLEGLARGATARSAASAPAAAAAAAAWALLAGAVRSLGLVAGGAIGLRVVDRLGGPGRRVVGP